MKKIIVLFIFVGIFIGNLSSQNTAVLKGKVSHKGNEIAGINILLKDTLIGTSTNNTGSYELKGIPQGEHKVEVRGVGWKNIVKSMRFKKGEIKKMNFELKSDVVEEEEVVVTATRSSEKGKGKSLLMLVQ
ncbi:MAG: carboxypeptidase-like regulatory domain-containing protein [Flavobacteriales bacterium]